MARKLAEIAHCRAGDKGDTVTLSLFPFRAEDYPLFVREVTDARVRAHLSGMVKGEVRRFELPLIHGLQFVCEQALDSGVTTSLALDTHGKTLSYALLELEIES
jgi:hypothetical protein